EQFMSRFDAGTERAAVERYVNAAKELRLLEAARQSGVPDAPFKTTWPELALKRMLRYASEHGYDKIAWTSGETQAARYDLSKQVDHLLYKKNADGTFQVSAQVPNRGGHMLGDSIPAEKLEDHVGKEVAQRIIDGAGKDENLGGPGTTSQPKDMWKKLA